MPGHLSNDEFAARYSRHHLDLLRFVISLVPDRAQADDIVQETARNLWLKIGEYDPSRPFWPWAKQFAYYEVLRHRKRIAIRRKYFSAELVETLADQHAEAEPRLEARRQALADCLEKLDDAARELVNQRYNYGCPIKELAEVQGRTPNSLYLALFSIRKKLLACITGRLARRPSPS